MKSFDLRNQELFLRNIYLGAGDYDIPMVRKQTIDLHDLQYVGYHRTKAQDGMNGRKTVHFFMDDMKFEGVWNYPQRSLERLRQYKQVLSPDFSLYTNMPLVMQVWNTFRRRWVSAYWQAEGLTVIPAVTWGDARSYPFCFDGIEKDAVLAVSTLGAKRYKDLYLPGFIQMIQRLQPKKVICYTTPFPEMHELCDMIEVPYESVASRVRKEGDT